MADAFQFPVAAGVSDRRTVGWGIKPRQPADADTGPVFNIDVAALPAISKNAKQISATLTMRQVARETNFSASLTTEASYGLVQASASVGGSNDTSYASDTLTLLINIAHYRQAKSADGALTKPRMFDDARSLLSSNSDSFASLYGTHVIDTIHTGSVLQLALTFNSVSASRRTQLTAALAVRAKSLQGGFAAAAKMSNVSIDKEMLASSNFALYGIGVEKIPDLAAEDAFKVFTDPLAFATYAKGLSNDLAGQQPDSDTILGYTIRPNPLLSEQDMILAKLGNVYYEARVQALYQAYQERAGVVADTKWLLKTRKLDKSQKTYMELVCHLYEEQLLRVLRDARKLLVLKATAADVAALEGPGESDNSMHLVSDQQAILLYNSPVTEWEPKESKRLIPLPRLIDITWPERRPEEVPTWIRITMDAVLVIGKNNPNTLEAIIYPSISANLNAVAIGGFSLLEPPGVANQRYLVQGSSAVIDFGSDSAVLTLDIRWNGKNAPPGAPLHSQPHFTPLPSMLPSVKPLTLYADDLRVLCEKSLGRLNDADKARFESLELGVDDLSFKERMATFSLPLASPDGINFKVFFSIREIR